MADPTKLTRNDLAQFLPNQRAIRAFEQLFGLVPDDLMAARFSAESAESKANVAIAALNRIADSLETLAKAPPREIGRAIGADYIDFPTGAPSVTAERRLAWSDADGTTKLGLFNGATTRLSQDVIHYVINSSGVSISKGQGVMITGTNDSLGLLKVAKAVANGSVSPDLMLGIAAHDIADSTQGYVIRHGFLSGVDTSAFIDGDTLYFSSGTPGSLTKTQPAAPNLRAAIAIVIDAANPGSIFVRMKSGERVSGLHDVFVSSPGNGHLLIYDAGQGRWENSAIAPGANIDVSNGGGSITISTVGASGSFDADGGSPTISVSNGIITSIV